MHILLTGVAGFIGMHVARRLLADGHTIIGVDNLHDYYDVALKKARLHQLAHPHFHFHKIDLNEPALKALFTEYTPQVVVHLAAQPGVRYSLENPQCYIDSNLVGFGKILEYCRHAEIDHLVYASSSSVYGLNTELPFRETHRVDHPASLYGASKKANELMAHTYSHLFGLPTTGLRFFTVYGPWGRPDMALFLFTQAMLAKQPIAVFNHGQMVRDFTYIDDVVEGVVRVMHKPATASGTDAQHRAPWRVFNLGNGNPIPLADYIVALETALGLTAEQQFLPLQAGDVVATAADTRMLQEWVNFQPNTSVTTGVAQFVAWYREYYCA